MYDVGMTSDTHNDIAGFEVAVNKVPRVDVLHAMKLGVVDISPSVVVSEVEFTHQLHSQKRYSLDRELGMALNKEVLEGLTETINHHCIEASFPAKPMDVRDTSPSLKLCVDMVLMA
jgi:hypothetical protein